MPAEYVLDNSVILRAFLQDREGSDPACKILALVIARDIQVAAPKNVVHEFCGALCKAFRRRGKTVDEAVQAIREFFKLPISCVESEELIERAIKLAFIYHKGFYDMYYFAVAESKGVPVCTADKRSIDGLAEDFPCEYVLLDDFFKEA
jgi:predicted nucleic acid-binding protein